MTCRHLPSARLRGFLPLLLGALAACLAWAPGARAASVAPATSTTLPTAIADGGNAGPPQYGATTTLAFPVSGLPSGPITDVQVKLTSTHTYVGDLDVVLAAPGGSPTRTIFSRTLASAAAPFGSAADFLGPYTFADSAPASPSWWSAAAASTNGSVPAGSYRASEPGGAGASGASTLITPTFTNATANGTWQLQVRDGSQSGTGSITAASLVVRVAGTTTVVPAITGAGVAVNEPLPFAAAVTGGSGNVSGTLSFDVYGPDTAACTGTPAFTGDAASAGTTVVNAPSLAATAPGLYRVRVRYSGDGDNQASTSACNAAASSVIVSPPFVTFDDAPNQMIPAGAPTTPAGRPFRSGVQSFCGAPNTPSVSGSTPTAYLTYAHTNAASTPNCVRARVSYPASCSTPSVFLQSYARPFTASALNANYLGDAGSSVGGSGSGYTVGAGQAFDDVVFAVSSPSCVGFDVLWQSTRPWSSTPPSVSAAPTVGSAVTAAEGTWSGSPSFGYVWRRCAADGTSCTDIAGASGRSYTPVADDLGRRLAVRVSASFVDQTSIAESAPGDVVASAPTATTTTTTGTPTTTPPPSTPPRLSIGKVGQLSRSWKRGKLRASLGTPPRSAKVGTVFSFSLTRPATLTLSFTRQVKGRKVGSKCVAATKGRVRRPSCTRGLAAGSLNLAAKAAGGQRVVFQGRLSASKTLAPGRYALVVKASADGQTAAAGPVTFTVRK